MGLHTPAAIAPGNATTGTIRLTQLDAAAPQRRCRPHFRGTLAPRGHGRRRAEQDNLNPAALLSAQSPPARNRRYGVFPGRPDLPYLPLVGGTA